MPELYIGTWFPTFTTRHTAFTDDLPVGEVALNRNGMVYAQWRTKTVDIALSGSLKINKYDEFGAVTGQHTIPFSDSDTDVPFRTEASIHDLRDLVFAGSDKRLQNTTSLNIVLGGDYVITPATTTHNEVKWTLDSLDVFFGVGMPVLAYPSVWSPGQITEFNSDLFQFEVTCQAILYGSESSGFKGDPLDVGYPLGPSITPFEASPFGRGVQISNDPLAACGSITALGVGGSVYFIPNTETYAEDVLISIDHNTKLTI